MAETAQKTATKKVLPIATAEDILILTNFRDDLDRQSDEALQKNNFYLAGIFTEVVVFVDAKINSANRYSRRIANAHKRKQVKVQRKQQLEATKATNANANPSQARA